VAYELPAGAIYPAGFDIDEVSYPPTFVREFAQLNYGKALQERVRRPGAVPVYGTNGQCGWHDTPLAKPPGVILGRKGQGHLGVKWCEKPFWVIDTAYYASLDQEQADPRWFYYITKFVGLDELKTGEKPGLNRDTFLSQVFPLPTVEEQRDIVEVLTALDDKIELNSQINHTLEEMASALFKSWFVDFDPVVAKADGRAPFGLDPRTAALFPSTFQVDPHWGDIPTGWKTMPLDAVANFKNGLALQKYRPDVGAPRLPVIKIAQLRTGQPGTKEWARADINPACVLGNGDIVFSWSGSLTVVVWCGGPGALNQHLFKVTSARFPKWFYHQWTLHHLPEFQAIAADKATTMGHIRRYHLTEARCVVPPDPVIEAAGTQLEAWMDLFIHNELESQTLASLRDALLPKLLSGDLRPKQAALAVEAVL